MKQRFNALDVRATVKNLKERLIGIRLQNVYDVNAKTFLFKFAKPDDKELVLVESGIRIHSTQFSREKSDTPSMFCAKLRKHLRTRRVTNVRQLGVDRVVDFEFAGGDMGIGYHIICEFYASGNIILTDHEYKILALLRAVQPSENLKIAVGETYNFETVKDFEKVDEEQLRTVLRSAGPKDNLKKILNLKFEYGPAMVEHMIIEACLDPNLKVATDFDTSEGSPMMKALLEAMDKGDELIKSTQNAVPQGYIILLDDKHKPKVEKPEEVEIYDEFHPFLYKQFENRNYKEFDTFDKAVDEFFSAIESQKLEMKARRQEEAALKKLEAVRKEQESRVQSLLDQQHTNVRKAQLIEVNLQLVDAAITIIRNAVASQMDWQDLNDLVKEEKRRQNPIAMIIDGLKLQTNQITLLLSDPDVGEESDSEDSDDDEEEENSDQENRKEEKSKEPSTVKIDVEIGLSAFANARKYYEQKKTTASKHEKTIEASSKALKSAERKIRQDLKETKITATINKIRKPFWFEKFLWFISTDGHLVIAGRDMQQNEMLVKRYLLKDDVYVHADLHGAASVIVKNKPNANGQPVPPSTLYQAGIMSVCQSKAWDAKMVTSAYWVYPDQVSKSAPSGEYLTTGSFMIRGKKNFLPPVQLVYGFGYVFKLDESSVGNHVKARAEESTNAEQQDVKADSNNRRENKVDYRDAIEIDTAKDTPRSSAPAKIRDEKAEIVDEMSEKSTETVAVGKIEEKDMSESDEDESSDDSSSDEEENAFPDTQLQSLPTNTIKETGKDSLSKADKYDLDDYGHDSAEDQVSVSSRSSGTNTPTKKRISAKERRLMKKLNATELTEAIISEKEKAKQQKQNQPKQQQQQQQQQKVAQAKSKTASPATPSSTRGRKGKAKKIKDKYADQDEEERQLRMELLGSSKGPQPKGKKAKREARAKEEKAALERERAAKKAAMEAKACPGKKQDEEGATGVDGNDVPKAIKGVNDKDTETIRQMLKEENITVLEADEVANLSILDSLTANPLPEDIIHFAIPVCAPYAAIQKYKYKVKLTPGALKRGKAVKQAQSVFLNLSDATAREKELIKGVPDMESINTMMSKVKVSAPNLEASKRKKTAGRK